MKVANRREIAQNQVSTWLINDPENIPLPRKQLSFEFLARLCESKNKYIEKEDMIKLINLKIAQVNQN